MKEGKSINYFLMRYKTSLANDITKFELEFNEVVNSGNSLREKPLCCTLSLHTKLLLHQIKATKNIVLALNQCVSFMIDVNIFHTEVNVVSEYDVENDLRFSELGLSEGDEYVKVSLLLPELYDHWREIFNFRIHDVIDNKHDIDTSTILNICFEFGVIRKEICYELVWLQYQLISLIVPLVAIGSHCKVSPTSSKCVLNQCNGVLVSTPKDINFLQPNLNDFDNISIGNDYKNHDKNVARLAVFLKKEIENNKERSLLVYPSFDNLKGIDYVIYTETEHTEPTRTPTKRRKLKTYTLYLVQVATGATHTGVTIGEALSVFKDIIKNVPLHVMILIARKERDSYTLTGNVAFDNVSVVNLTRLGLHGILKENKLLTGFVEMIRKS